MAILHFLKNPLFPTVWFQKNKSWRVLRDLTRLSESLVSQFFSQYWQIYMNLKIKVVKNSTVHKNARVALW